MVYADNAATTQLSANAFEAMKPYLLEEYANPSQPYAFARKPKQAIIESRKKIAECIGASPDEIYFTSGGTESNNWAIKGSAFCDICKSGIITSQIEHHSVLRACDDIAQMGYPVSFVPVDSTGRVQTDQFLQLINNHSTRMVSIMFANNEIGSIQSIAELTQIAHSHEAIFHTDAVQAVGHIKINVKEHGVDMLSASAHKFNGPKGIGFLYIKNGIKINALISGGMQETGMRAGTENVAFIVGMAEALRINCEQMEATTKHLFHLEDFLIQILQSNQLNFIRNGWTDHIPGNISLSFPGKDGEAILHRLDLMGICVSTGSACDSKNTRISHVLQAIGLDEKYARGTIRISLGKTNTENDVLEIANALIKILK